MTAPAPDPGGSLSGQLASLHASLAQGPAGDVITVLDAERARYAALGAGSRHLEAGAPMPDGDLLDATGQPTTLAAARDGRPAVVVFYRGAWCPYCNLTLRAYQRQLVPALGRLGVPLIAISPQAPDGSLTMQETNELTYLVLSDPGNQIASALGILAPETSDQARHAAAATGTDVASHNADGTDLVPSPATVIVDPGGIIAWIDVHPDYATRTEPRQILDAIAHVTGRDRPQPTAEEPK